MAGETRYFMYARKSTDVEDKQVRSIDAQLVELRELASRCGLHVVDELIEKESAKLPGTRDVFNRLLDRIESGEANAILAWHPDRLSRNPLDGSRIVALLDSGKLQRLQFYGSCVDNTPQGKMMLSIEFGFSKYYIDSLSENTKRGQREKVRRGEYPCIAPLGYLNDRRTKRIVVDRRRAPIVREAFERYATGNETLETIRQFFASRGIRSRTGKLLCRAQVSNVLSSPIYYGHFKWSGEMHEGIHEPIISKKLFDAVQAVFEKRWRYSPAEIKRAPKAFVGLLHCAECGYAITAEVQKGHTYYRCSKKRKDRPCSQPYIREEALDRELSSLLPPFQLCSEWTDEMLARIDSEQILAAETAAALSAEKRAAIEAIRPRIERLTDTLVDGLIDHDEYRERKARLLAQKKTLEEEAASLSNGKLTWLEPFRNWVLAAKTLGEIATHGSLTAKRALAKEIFGSNLVLDLKKARGRAVNPWALIPKLNRGDTLVYLYYQARTHFQDEAASLGATPTPERDGIEPCP